MKAGAAMSVVLLDRSHNTWEVFFLLLVLLYEVGSFLSYLWFYYYYTNAQCFSIVVPHVTLF